MKGNPQSRQI